MININAAPLLIISALLLTTERLFAQSELGGTEELDLLMSLDERLFSMARSSHDDPYAEATKSYSTPVNERRRGLDWWVARDLNRRFLPQLNEYLSTESGGRIRLIGASRRYQYGAMVEYGHTTDSGWAAYLNLDYRAGRDCNVEGVFSQEFTSQLEVGREFERGHNLNITIDVPILMRGLQSSATSESFALTGDKLYNPSWGLYGGEVRNSRVSRNSVSQLAVCYNRELRNSTSMTIDMEANYGRRSLSRLGWYDAYNPTPDYYRKMPSYLADGETKSAVEQVWRDEDEEYTQIAWDKLVTMNQLSSSGEARYIIEDQVTREANMDLTALFRQDVSPQFTLCYGAAASLLADRLFKEVDDLLGAEYHLDTDQYIDDEANYGNDMQNDLRNPNRHVTEGGRFGYDYTRHQRVGEALLGVEYLDESLSIDLHCRFGESRMWREGHFEKERFAGSASYGNSKAVESTTSSLDLFVGYSPADYRHRFTLHGALCRVPQYHQDLFLDEQSANRVVDNSDPQRVAMVSLGYNLRLNGFHLDVEGYYQHLANQSDVWSGYDDISYNYTDIVVSGISMRSIGLEAACSYRVSRMLNLDMTLSLGDYTYDKAPLVQLYESDDMTLLSESESIATEGCKVGNAPQFILCGGVDVTVRYGLNISLDCSYAAGRYVAPSFARRTERVLRAAGTSDLVTTIVEQRSLGSAFDVGLSVMRSIELRDGHRLSIYARVDNLLGDRDRVDYGREGSRVLRGDTYSTTGLYYAESDKFTYCMPRTYYISLSYRW